MLSPFTLVKVIKGRCSVIRRREGTREEGPGVCLPLATLDTQVPGPVNPRGGVRVAHGPSVLLGEPA